MTKLRHFFTSFLIVFISCAGTGCLSGGGGSGGDSPAAASDRSNFSLSITDPEASEIDTIDESIDLGGVASSSSGLVSVTWRSDQGADGTATGTSNWQTGPIALELGRNTITVSATNAHNNTASDTIVVNRDSGEKGAITLSWTAPTERADGTPLMDLSGYQIHYGRLSKTYDYIAEIDNPGILTYVVEGLSPGRWYFAIVAFDSDGTESEPSKEANAHIK